MKLANFPHSKLVITCVFKTKLAITRLSGTKQVLLLKSANMTNTLCAWTAPAG